jgi:chemotaxis response regulator CheB
MASPIGPFYTFPHLTGSSIVATLQNRAEIGVKMSQPIRVIVANRPRLMRDLVIEAIVEQPDIEIIAEIQNEPDICRIVNEKRPDFLIITLEESNNRPAICDILLQQFPDMKILALSPERNSSIFYWASFNIHSNQVEASEAGILGTLRGRGQYV